MRILCIFVNVRLDLLANLCRLYTKVYSWYSLFMKKRGLKKSITVLSSSDTRQWYSPFSKILREMHQDKILHDCVERSRVAGFQRAWRNCSARGAFLARAWRLVARVGNLSAWWILRPRGGFSPVWWVFRPRCELKMCQPARFVGVKSSWDDAMEPDRLNGSIARGGFLARVRVFLRAREGF